MPGSTAKTTALSTDEHEAFPKAAVTVQEVAPGEFRYWLVHLEPGLSGPDVQCVEESPNPYASAQAAWAAGVQECRRLIETPETDKDRERREEIRKDVEMAKRSLAERTKK